MPCPFEIYRLRRLPNVVTSFLLKCSPIHGALLSTHIWYLILSGNLYVDPLSPTQAQGFSPLLTLLLGPDHRPKSETHPTLLAKVFSSFQDFLLFINGCKWFLMSVCHPTYYYSTIALQGLFFLEDQMKSSNMAARWQDPTIQTAPASYQFLELVHNLFTTLSTTSCKIPQSSLLPTMITVPDTNPSFLISPTIQYATLTVDLNVTIQK